MENGIYEKLNEIKDINDRILLKKIINSVFESLEEYSKIDLTNQKKEYLMNCSM